MIKTLKISIIILLCGFSFVLAQEPDTLQTDSTQQLDMLFARARGGLVEYGALADSSKKVLINMGKDVVPYTIEKLSSKDVRDVIAGIDILKAIGNPAIPYLIESLTDTSEDKVVTVIRTLGEMKDKSAVMPLTNMLNNNSFRIRGATCTALGLIGDSLATSYLIPLLNDTVNLVRKSVAFALGQTNNPKAVHYLIGALSDEFYGTRFAAGNSLFKLGNSATKSLIPLLNSDDLNLRCLVIEILGKIKDKRAFEPLLKNLNDSDWAVRGFTIEAISNLGNGRATKAIKDLEKTEKHPFVKRKIQEALGRAI